MARSKVTTARVIGAPIGGSATKTAPIAGPALADLLPYAPPVDRADFQAFTCDDTCPQQRINYE